MGYQHPNTDIKLSVVYQKGSLEVFLYHKLVGEERHIAVSLLPYIIITIEFNGLELLYWIELDLWTFLLRTNT